MKETEAQEELAFIKKVMEDSRRIVAHDGNEYIVWGVLVVVGMIAMYINIAFQYYFHFALIWGILIGGGWVYSLVRWFTFYRKMPIKTFAKNIIGSVWLACGIVMTLIGFALAPLGVIQGWAIMPLIGLVLGIAYFVTGKVIKEKWIGYSTFGWWIGALVIAAFPGVYMFLLFAGMMICFQIIPGIMLQKRYKKELEQHHA